MDLLAAEIARKRKAKAELAAVGGVRKYAKKGQKEEAARRALLGAEEHADRGSGAAVARGEVRPGQARRFEKIPACQPRNLSRRKFRVASARSS